MHGKSADGFLAAPLGLLEEDSPGASLTTMLQGLTRFLLDRVAHDWRTIPPHSLAFDQVRSVFDSANYVDFKRFCLPPLPLRSGV